MNCYQVTFYFWFQLSNYSRLQGMGNRHRAWKIWQNKSVLDHSAGQCIRGIIDLVARLSVSSGDELSISSFSLSRVLIAGDFPCGHVTNYRLSSPSAGSFLSVLLWPSRHRRRACHCMGTEIFWIQIFMSNWFFLILETTEWRMLEKRYLWLINFCRIDHTVIFEYFNIKE